MSEFGSRRAQGADGALLGARASYIAGCAGTACAMADQMFRTPATGTMAHSWVQMFPDEYTAFKTYCQVYPESATLLVDTYNVLKSGVPNAIRAFKELGHHLWRHPHRLRRSYLFVPEGPANAGRCRAAWHQDYRLQFTG